MRNSVAFFAALALPLGIASVTHAEVQVQLQANESSPYIWQVEVQIQGNEVPIGAMQSAFSFSNMDFLLYDPTPIDNWGFNILDGDPFQLNGSANSSSGAIDPTTTWQTLVTLNIEVAEEVVLTFSTDDFKLFQDGGGEVPSSFVGSDSVALVSLGIPAPASLALLGLALPGMRRRRTG